VWAATGFLNMVRNPVRSFVPNGKNSKMIPRYFLKPNAQAHLLPEAGATQERRL
jgi:hypothetical protein